ncbi:MAG: hypothetical protein KGD65_13655 [Candidatus Lokiarchaeota archaeon]|nr:hypothetical protein [Candidatus Lokiarchaeota archaeon]
MALNPLDIINGIFSFIFVVISLVVGVLILIRYFRYKEKIYFLVGATWILISEPWWPSSLSFLVSLSNGIGLPPTIYFLIGNMLIPVAIAFWLLAFTEFLLTEKRKLILLVFAIIGVIFEIIFFTLLFINPDLIGYLNPPVDVSYNFFIMIFLLIFILIVVISGFFFARLSLKSDDPEVKLKGKLLVVAYIAFFLGALLDSSIRLNELGVIFVRLILIASAVFWYGGFLLPHWMRKLFLKQK